MEEVVKSDGPRLSGKNVLSPRGVGSGGPGARVTNVIKLDLPGQRCKLKSFVPH